MTINLSGTLDATSTAISHATWRLTFAGRTGAWTRVLRSLSELVTTLMAKPGFGRAQKG
jgi:hypothetical protein